MGKIKTLSVVIPTYNRHKYIGQSVQSVLDQVGNFKCEIIVIDDGSTDETEKVLTPLKKYITYKRIPNSGRPAIPRNIGIRLARNKIVAFQDSDDLWVKDKIKQQLQFMENPDIILSYGNAEVITPNGERTGKTVISKNFGKSGHVFEELLKTNFISTLTVMTQREALMGLGGFNESKNLKAVEDYELWLRLSRLGEFAFIDKPLAYYRRHDANVSHTIDAALNEHILAVYKELLRQSLLPRERRAVHKEKAKLLEINSSQLRGVKNLINKSKIFYERRLAGS